MTRRGNARGVRRAMLTAVVVSALGLAACGSDSEGDEETTSASAASSSESAGSSASSETSAESEESKDPSASESAPESEPADEPESEAPGGEPAQDNADNADSGANNAANQAQRQGDPASGDDASQIRGVSEGLAGDRSYADYMQYVYDTTCTADIDRLGGRESYQQQISEARKENKQWSEVAGESNIPAVHGVNDIQVQGDRATANVDRTIGGNRGSEVVTYVREDGGWKTCANA